MRRFFGVLLVLCISGCGTTQTWTPASDPTHPLQAEFVYAFPFEIIDHMGAYEDELTQLERDINAWIDARRSTVARWNLHSHLRIESTGAGDAIYAVYGENDGTVVRSAAVWRRTGRTWDRIDLPAGFVPSVSTSSSRAACGRIGTRDVWLHLTDGKETIALSPPPDTKVLGVSRTGRWIGFEPTTNALIHGRVSDGDFLTEERIRLPTEINEAPLNSYPPPIWLHGGSVVVFYEGHVALLDQARFLSDRTDWNARAGVSFIEDELVLGVRRSEKEGRTERSLIHIDRSGTKQHISLRSELKGSDEIMRFAPSGRFVMVRSGSRLLLPGATGPFRVRRISNLPAFGLTSHRAPSIPDGPQRWEGAFGGWIAIWDE